jgi:hypothetical protein
MKYLKLSLIFSFCLLAHRGIAQKFCDLEITFHYPANGHQVHQGDSVQFVAALRNNGPDDITTADSIVFRIDFGLDLLRVADIPAGDVYLDTFMMFTNHLSADEEQNLCIFLLPDDHIGFADTLQSNDTACISFMALGPSSIREAHGSAPLSIHPNPAGEEVYVSLPYPVKEGNLSVWDIAGKQILALPLEFNQREVRLQVAQLRSGIYFISIHAERGSYRSRFVKQ